MNTLLLLLAASPSAVPAADPPIDAIGRCASLMVERDLFAGTVAISRDGRLLRADAYAPAAAAANAQTPYNIASAGKMFTAVAIGQLADSGRLDFDDPIGRHLPGVAPEMGRITIAQLLNHTGGLADYFRPENREAISAARTAHDLLPLALAGGVQFDPGTRRAYSNSGFVVLGAIVEAVTGRNYDEYVREHVFVPAGMTSTSLTAPAGAATPLTRRGAESGAVGPPPRRPAPSLDGGHASPAGGAYSTASDLARFADALMANRLTRRATTEALIQFVGPTRVDPAGEIRGYGYGFNISELAGTRFAGHGGGSPGMNAELAFSPASRTAVAILSNYDPPAASVIARFARAAIARPSSPPDPAICLDPARHAPPQGPAGGANRRTD